MERFGYFGKIPSAKDFIFQGLPMRTTERWAGFIAEWLARGNRVHKDDWRRHMLTSPIWRFVLGPEIISPEGWVGLFASSIDGAGRLFPFTAMIEANIDPGRRQPFDALDGVLDRLEPAFLDFMESGTEKSGLIAALEAASKATRSLAETTNEDILPLLPETAEQAVCLVGLPSPAGAARLMAHPGRAGTAEATPAFSAWWHGGTSTVEPAHCISRGMPPALVALPFFDADWDRHGWVRR